MSDPIANDSSKPELSEAPATSPPGATPAVPSAHVTSSLAGPSGYEMLCEIGQGGMGIVFRARQVGLDRLVAIKRLRERFTNNSAAVARFLREARITARLQHPGIPPVHEVATWPEGQPYLVMKLIEGRNLDKLVKEQGAGATRRWLGVFEAVCQAVGYAHSQGVIHRDLKPGNVMVGAFGEVQVMDWGLAKVLASREFASLVEDTDPLATKPPDDLTAAAPDQTQPGSVLGTPAFMPPEQAIGAIERLDRRGDVFSLGAILCFLLTGAPPFEGPNAEACRQLAAQGKLDDAFARLDVCGADPAIVALCKECLSFQIERRPADAGVLAQRIAAFQNESQQRLRLAAMEQAAAEAREQEAMAKAAAQRRAAEAEVVAAQAREKEVRARAKAAKAGRIGGWLMLVAGSLLAGLLTGLVFGSVRQPLGEQAQREEARERDEVEAQRKKALDRAQADRAEAVKARDEARKRQYDVTLDAVELLIGFQGRLEHRPGVMELRKEGLALVREDLERLLDEAARLGKPDARLAWAYLCLGDVESILGNAQRASVNYFTGQAVARQLVKATPTDVPAQRHLASSHEKQGDLMLSANDAKEARASYQRAYATRLKLAQEDSNGVEAQFDLSVNLEKLSVASLRLEDAKAALAYASKEQEILRRVVGPEGRPNDAALLRALARSCNRMGDLMGKGEKAATFYEKSATIGERLIRTNPEDALARRELGASFDRLGELALRGAKPDEARGWYAKALQVRRRLTAGDGDRLREQAVSFEKLHAATRKARRLPAYETLLSELEVNKQLAAAAPNDVRAQTDLFVSYLKLGDSEQFQGNVLRARCWFAKGREVILPWQDRLVGEAKEDAETVNRTIAACDDDLKGVLGLRSVVVLLQFEDAPKARQVADSLAESAERQKEDREVRRYQAAAAYALCAAASENESKDALVAKAVALLVKLRDDKFFDRPNVREFFDRSNFFAGVREHPRFNKFLESLEK
jgi:tRNA A-37 threonylcarbamoyl transferase component Bud32